MSITAADLKFAKSATINDLSSNGGRLTANYVAGSVAGNVFPNTTEQQRIDGIPQRYRKLFVKNDNATDLTLFQATLFQDNGTPGDDVISFFSGVGINTQNDITGTERRYGSGVLSASAVISDTEIVVQVEDGNTTIIQNGDVIRISDKLTPTSVSGNEQYVTVVGAPVVALNELTITLDAPLSYNFLSGVTKVSSLLSMGDIVASIDSVTVATVGDGTYDHVGTPVAAFNKGTIDETFTLTFTSGTAFDIEGFAIGAVGSGNISSGAAPVNPDTGVEYFEIFAGGFSGTFATGDTIEIVTVASAYPIWLKHVVPAGAAAISSNTSTFVIDGQSA